MADPRQQGESDAERALSDGRVAVFARLMEAQEKIAHALAERGVAQEAFVEALAAVEAGAGPADEYDIYLAELARYVAALGGRLQVRAVFGERIVTVLGDDAPDDALDGALHDAPEDAPRDAPEDAAAD